MSFVLIVAIKPSLDSWTSA